MKRLAFLLTISIPPISGQILDTFEVSDVSLSIAKAAANIEKAIESFQQQLGHEQPVCLDPVMNYINCLTLPENIDDTEFLVHPLVPSGTVLSDLKGTPDYDLAYGMIESYREGIQNDLCGDTGKYGLAVYEWPAADQQSTISATSLVKDFQGPSNWGGRTSSSTTGLENYMCGTGPLSEEYVLKKSNAKKEMLYAYEALRGINNIQSAIKAVKVGGDEVQPPCMDALDNYIQCVTYPEDIDETEVVVHPAFPIGMKLGDLKGTSDYEYGSNMFEAFRSAVSTTDCEDVGSIGVAQYPWVKSDDRSTMVTATSLVMDFMGPANYIDRRLSRKPNGLRHAQETVRYLCATGPLAEDKEYDQEKENNYLVTSSAVVLKGFYNLQNALDNLDRENDDLQPACMDPITNYVKCLNIPDDIDETTFLVHPVVPVGTQLRVLKGTPDYDLGKNMIEALRDALKNDSCHEVGHVNVAKYPWLSNLDESTPVTAYSVVMEFMGATGWRTSLDGVELPSSFRERYMCSTGPILEEYASSGDNLNPILVNGKPDEDVEEEDVLAEETVEEPVDEPVEEIAPKEIETPPSSNAAPAKALPKPNVNTEKSFIEDTSGDDETGTVLKIKDSESDPEPNQIEVSESEKEESSTLDKDQTIKTGLDIIGSNSKSESTSDGGRMGSIISYLFSGMAVSVGVLLL